MPFSIEPVFPERIQVRVRLIVALTIRAFEMMGTWFSLFYFKSRWIDLEV